MKHARGIPHTQDFAHFSYLLTKRIIPTSNMIPHETTLDPGFILGPPSQELSLPPKVHVTSRTTVKHNIIPGGCIGHWVLGRNNLQIKRTRSELERGCSSSLGTSTDHDVSSLLWFLLPSETSTATHQQHRPTWAAGWWQGPYGSPSPWESSVRRHHLA